METLTAIWNWLVGLFNKTEQPEFANTPESTPKVDNPAPRRTVNMDDVVPEVGTTVPKTGTPTQNRIKKAAQTPAEYEPSDVITEQPTPAMKSEIEQAESAIRLHAELYETNQTALMSEIEGHEDSFIEAAYNVDWPAIVREYTNDTITRIQGSGTSFNFQGHGKLRRMIAAVVSAESARRAGKAPDRNGMAEDGRQR